MHSTTTPPTTLLTSNSDTTSALSQRIPNNAMDGQHRLEHRQNPLLALAPITTRNEAKLEEHRDDLRQSLKSDILYQGDRDKEKDSNNVALGVLAAIKTAILAFAYTIKDDQESKKLIVEVTNAIAACGLLLDVIGTTIPSLPVRRLPEKLAMDGYEERRRERLGIIMRTFVMIGLIDFVASMVLVSLAACESVWSAVVIGFLAVSGLAVAVYARW